MKSSTLHRSSLSREKMYMLENEKPENYGNIPSSDIGKYIKVQKKPEIDVLWRDFEKSIQSKSKAKAPIVYIGIGFTAGILCAFVLTLIITFSTITGIKSTDNIKTVPEKVANEAPVSVTPTGADNNVQGTTGLEEKYTIKAGDTLDKIAYRFYGKYDQEKINRIMQINNIKNETTIQIGQVIIIPLD